ncbi:hypothetical protein YPPY66_3012, partial [Yersinia pestis PY-66]
MNPSYKAGSG